MKVEKIQGNEALISFSKHELSILNNSMNEALEALDPEEFSTRMGAEVNEVEELLNQVGKAFRSV